MLPAKFFLCSIVGSDGESLCGNISQFVGPTLAPKGHVIELTTYFGALPCLGCGGTAAKSVWCNGGIPQLANLTWHKQQMTRQMPAKVSAGFDGIIDVDYESWYPENGNQTATDEARSWFEAHADVFRGEARAAPAPAMHRTATQVPRAAARVASAPPIDPMVPPPPYTKCSL